MRKDFDLEQIAAFLTEVKRAVSKVLPVERAHFTVEDSSLMYMRVEVRYGEGYYSDRPTSFVAFGMGAEFSAADQKGAIESLIKLAKARKHKLENPSKL